jgi:hypothetical protein
MQSLVLWPPKNKDNVGLLLMLGRETALRIGMFCEGAIPTTVAICQPEKSLA